MGKNATNGEAPRTPAPTPRPSGRGVTPTTVVLVVVLLGVLVFVGRIVNPPPPEPPKEEAPKTAAAPKPPAAPDAMAMRAQLEKQRRMQEQQKLEHEAMLKANHGKEPKIVSPNSTDISSDFFQDHKMGVEGVKQTEQEIEHSKQLEAAAKAASGRRMAPSETPIAAPPTTPPSP